MKPAPCGIVPVHPTVFAVKVSHYRLLNCHLCRSKARLSFQTSLFHCSVFLFFAVFSVGGHDALQCRNQSRSTSAEFCVMTKGQFTQDPLPFRRQQNQYLTTVFVAAAAAHVSTRHQAVY